jgi:hypothetical protein
MSRRSSLAAWATFFLAIILFSYTHVVLMSTVAAEHCGHDTGGHEQCIASIQGYASHELENILLLCLLIGSIFFVKHFFTPRARYMRVLRAVTWPSMYQQLLSSGRIHGKAH